MNIPDKVFDVATQWISYDITRKKICDIALFWLACFSIGMMIALYKKCLWLAQQFYLY